MLKVFTLKNGIKVATYSLPSLRSVHIDITTKGGSLVQDLQKNGVAHLMEHLLVQGIPSFPTVEDFSGYIEGLAGTYSAYTSPSTIGFDINVPFKYLEDGVKICSEVFFEPLFTEIALEKEKRVVSEELKQRMDSKWFKISEFYNEVRFRKNHPLTINVGGDIKIVEKLKREDLINFWSKFFTPKNTYIVVVGNFELAKLRRLLNSYFGGYSTGKAFTGFPLVKETDFSPKTVAIRHDPTLQTNYINFSFPGLCLSDPRKLRARQGLALLILGRLRNSRLIKLLRYKEGLVYDVGAGSYTLPGLGYIDITAEVSPDKLEQVVSLIVREVDTFAKHGPTEEELAFAKNFLSNQWLMAFDHPSSIAGWLEGGLVWEDRIDLPEDLVEAITDIKPDDVTEVMQKCWDFSRLNLVIQGPLENTPENIERYNGIIGELEWLMESKEQLGK